MSGLADILSPRREQVVRRWVERIAVAVAPGETPRSVLRDHMDVIVRALIEALGREEIPASVVPAREHGQRFRGGFELAALVREYGELREVVCDVADEAGQGPSGREMRLLAAFLERGIAEGVSEYDHGRAQAEQQLNRELREREELLWLTLDSAEAATWDVDLVACTTTGDARFFSFFGLPSEGTVPTDQVVARVHPDDRERVIVSVREAAERRDVKLYQSEFRTVPADGGGSRWVDVRGRVVREPDGRAVQMLGTMIDATERQHLRLALANARLMSDTALTAGEVGTFTWDVPTDRLYGDTNFSRIFSIQLDATGAAPVAAYLAALHPDDQGETMARVTRSVQTGSPYEAEYRVVSGGHTRWVVARGRVDQDETGRPLRLVGVVMDITERRTAEERYRTLFESIDEGCCLIELLFDEQEKPVDYRFLQINHAFETQTTFVDAVGKRMREIIPDIDALWIEFYGRVATTGEPARTESQVTTLGRWYSAYAVRIGPAEQRQVMVLFNDITERKHLEAERERLLSLETTARQQAEDVSRIKDDFIATVSHELRTPLTSMLGWVQMLRAGSLPPERRDRALETIERNTRSQAQLVNDLLDMSRILSGKLRLEVEPLEVAGVVEAALETVRPSADARSIRLQSVLDTCGVVMGDPQRLQQVVWNLLTNAIKFTPKGGRVHTIVQCLDSSVELTVADTGQGMSADFLPHAFDRFRQAEGSITRTHGGLGLGLSIVKHLVELHGGTVSAFSEGEGKGSRFTVRLPLAILPRHGAGDAHSLPPASDPPPTSSELAGLRLLIIDDDEDTRSLLAFLLESHGAQVQQAVSVAAARQHFEAARPDLVVSDIGMPGEDGYAFVSWLRGRSPDDGGDMPAVALTAYARSQDRTRALLAGFNHHIAKPIDQHELLAVITSLLRHRPLARS